MAAWQERFKDKLITMEEAAGKINSGDGIFCGETCNISYNFLDALYKRKEELKDVTIMYNFSVGMFDMLFDESSRDSFRIMSWFTGPLDRMSGQMGVLEYHSAPYEYFIRETMDVYKANTMVIEVCPPDDDGYTNISILGAAYFKGFMDHPTKFTRKIAVVNNFQGPAKGKDEVIKVKSDWFDYYVEDDHELPYIPVSDPTEVDKVIGGHIMPYINDGDVVQIGMGGLGEQITKELHTKHDMTVYTEITVDSMVPLVEEGNVKKIITAGAFGTPKVYEFLSNDPRVEMRDLGDMLDPYMIGKQDNLVTINSTLMVDLTGQACSESQGINQYSSVGGSFGYSYGVTRSKGGRGFLCLRSTYKDKDGNRQSSIVPWLPEKSVVTTPRYLQMFIVSENGVADVFLKTNKDRIRAIIKIAHPDYIPWLKEQIVSSGQIMEEELKI